jgi:hypothetical protein
MAAIAAPRWKKYVNAFLLAYLLSMGFKPMNFLPEVLYPTVSKIEKLTIPLWRRVVALRVFLVLEKSPQP